MTAVTTTPAVTAAEPRARFRDLGAAEWLKFWSLRSTPWSFVISALVILGLNAGAAYEHVHYWHANRFAPATFIADGLPFQVWNRLTAIPFNPVARAYPWTITGAWTLFAVWALVAAVLAVAAVQRRDVLEVARIGVICGFRRFLRRVQAQVP